MFNIFKKNNKDTKTYKIDGMHCESCATMIESDLEDEGIDAKCSYAKQTLVVNAESDLSKIEKIVKKSGYELK